MRALRLYDEAGLLRPQTVDADSGYRYNGGDQLGDAELINRLWHLDMSLDDIGHFLRGQDSDRLRLLENHRARLYGRAEAINEAIRNLDRMTAELGMPAERRKTNLRDVTSMTIKVLPDQPVLRIRSEEEEGKPVGDAIREAAAAALRQGIRWTDPPYFCRSEPDDHGVTRWQAGIPADRMGIADGRVEPAVLPGGRIATVRYTGDYWGAPIAYLQLLGEIEAAGLIPRGDPRSVFVTDPAATPNPEDHRTDVMWPVQD